MDLFKFQDTYDKKLRFPNIRNNTVIQACFVAFGSIATYLANFN